MGTSDATAHRSDRREPYGSYYPQGSLREYPRSHRQRHARDARAVETGESQKKVLSRSITPSHMHLYVYDTTARCAACEECNGTQHDVNPIEPFALRGCVRSASTSSLASSSSSNLAHRTPPVGTRHTRAHSRSVCGRSIAAAGSRRHLVLKGRSKVACDATADVDARTSKGCRRKPHIVG